MPKSSFRLNREFRLLESTSRLPRHVGTGRWGEEGAFTLRAKLLFPHELPCLILLKGAYERLPPEGYNDAGLYIEGDSPDGSFRLECPEFSVHPASTLSEKPGWVIATPLNHGFVITYRSSSVARVEVVINNFDFERPNHILDTGQGMSRPALRVEASGRSVIFEQQPDYLQVKQLLEAGLARSASLTKFSFASWKEARDDQLIEFCRTIADLCSLATQQHTGMSVVSMFTSTEEVVKRYFRPPVLSRFRAGGILNNSRVHAGIPKLFEQCFEEYSRMVASTFPWHKLKSYWASIQDPPYLEQKFAT